MPNVSGFLRLRARVQIGPVMSELTGTWEQIHRGRKRQYRTLTGWADPGAVSFSKPHSSSTDDVTRRRPWFMPLLPVGAHPYRVQHVRRSAVRGG